VRNADLFVSGLSINLTLRATGPDMIRDVNVGRMRTRRRRAVPFGRAMEEAKRKKVTRARLQSLNFKVELFLVLNFSLHSVAEFSCHFTFARLTMTSRKRLLHSILLVYLLLFVTLIPCSCFSEDFHQEDGNKDSLTAATAEEEEEVDDRTLLDVFGQAAKEYLTTQVVCDYYMIWNKCFTIFILTSDILSCLDCRFQRRMPTVVGTGDMVVVNLFANATFNQNGATFTWEGLVESEK